MFLVKVPEGSSPVSVILRTLTVLSFSFSDNEFWISSEMMYIFFAEKKFSQFGVTMEFLWDLIVQHWKQGPRHRDLHYVQPSFFKRHTFPPSNIITSIDQALNCCRSQVVENLPFLIFLVILVLAVIFMLSFFDCTNSCNFL